MVYMHMKVPHGINMRFSLTFMYNQYYITFKYRYVSIMRAAPFSITIIQVYATTSGHDDSEVDHFYQKLQETIDKTPKKDFLVVQGDWNVKVGKDTQADWGEVCGPYCNVETNERGLRLLEFATLNNLVLTNTLGPHKPSRRWTWHSPDGKHHNRLITSG